MKEEKAIKCSHDPLLIGVLALQGGFSKHLERIHSLGCKACEVRTPADLERCHGLIIPGGESTVMFRHLERSPPFREKILAFAKDKPVFGTCAGLILMSEKIEGGTIPPFHLLDVTVERNAFGRQADSFKTTVTFELEQQKKKEIPALFIRAPRIRHCSSAVKILATFQQEPVLVQQGIHLGASFHPELTDDQTVHTYFLEIVKKSKHS